MRTVKRSMLAVLAGSVILATALTGCANDTSTPSPAASAEPLSPYSAQQSVEQFAGIEYDYDPAASPSALADQSSLVVMATIDRVQEGRLEIVPKSPNEPGISTIVVVLSDTEAVRGDLPAGNDGLLYVELPNPGQQEAGAYDGGLRAGARVVAYLVPAGDGEPTDDVDFAIAEPEAGRPAGQALFITAGPQGLILQYENEAVVWPLIGEQRDGNLEDTLPGGQLIAS